MKYLKELDGVRGIATLMVMFFHFFQIFGFHGSWWKEMFQKFSVFGQTGVTLFFVLSGFLITRILISTKTEHNFFKAFYVRRLLRIFPLYYAFLIVYYFILPMLSNGPFVAWGQQWYFWVYLQNFAYTFNWNINGPYHFWSLAVEEHFYFFWPMLVYFLPLKKLTGAAYTLIVISLVSRIILLSAGYGVFCFTFTNLDALAAGVLLATKENNYGLSSFSAKKFAALLLIFVIPTVILWFFTGGKSLWFIQAFKFPLIAFVYYCCIGLVIASHKNVLIKAVFNCRPLVFTGKISYGLYVYHPLIFTYCALHWQGQYFLYSLAICFTAAFITASLSYFWFESKISALKKYFEYGDKTGLQSKKIRFKLFNKAGIKLKAEA